METATEKIIRLLLVYPKKQFKQVELARNVGCSKVFVSKIIKKFTEEGILSKISKNEFRLISFSKLINIIAHKNYRIFMCTTVKVVKNANI